MGNEGPVLDVQGLRTSFFTRWGVVEAVGGVSFSLYPGETLGLVGESGCGKSVAALSLVRLVPQPPGRITAGKVILEGEDLLAKSDSEMQKVRGCRISMILQDPLTSLDPLFTIGFQVGEGISIHDGLRGEGLHRKVREMLSLVRIASPEARMRSYPHEMSGGMRQRVVGAMALSCHPSVLIADEPTTSLDVTVQAQYLRLLRDIQRSAGMSILFITHDFGVVAEMCDRVAVMYAGRIVESAPTPEIFDRPLHPYTRALMAAVPTMDSKAKRLCSIEGQPPLPYRLPAGCAFEPRCPCRGDNCRQEFPPEAAAGGDHTVSCWRAA